MPGSAQAASSFRPGFGSRRRELGVTEYAGERANLRVLEYHRHTSLEAMDDKVPRCAAFANACMDWLAKPKTKSAAAALWLGRIWK